MRHYAELMGVGNHIFEWHIYRQPLWRHALAAFYCDVWEPRTRRLVTALDRPTAWLHDRRCNNDCMTGYRVKTGADVPMCGRIPLYARQDLRCYSLTTAARIDVAETPATQEQAYAAGWPRPAHDR